MAQINTKLSLKAPQEIVVPLVRADHLAVSNVYRIFFEIFLSLTCGLVGVVLSIDKPTPLHWIALVACLVFSIVFVLLHYRSCRTGTISPSE